MRALDLLLGRRLANNQQETRRIGWFEAVPAMGLDGLGSSSYGPEAALTIMIPLGAASLRWIGPIMVGRGVFYYVAMTSLLAVLCLSANTSFVGFPRLCRLVAADGFLPRSFAVADRRLVFSVGITFLTVTAGGLLVAFGGITDRLIPLFAIGAFLTFTMSQVGMVRHWLSQTGRNRHKLAINALGDAVTIAALAVIVVAKFLEGAWIVVLAIPSTIALLIAINRYYKTLDRRTRAIRPVRARRIRPADVPVAVEGRSRMSDRALQFAMTLSPDVIAVHLLKLEGPEAEEDGRAMKEAWQRDVVEPLQARNLTAPRLVTLPASYREIHRPLLDFMGKLDSATPGRSVAVLIPELVLRHWWERLLHNRRADQLRAALLEHGGPRLNVIISPWRN